MSHSAHCLVQPIEPQQETRCGFENRNGYITDINRFLKAQGVNNFNDSYVSASEISPTIKDTIFKLPVGTVYGPYIDGDSFSLAKLLGVRTQPDTVNVRHILVATAQQRSPNRAPMR